MVWVIIGSIWILPSMYQSTIFGTSVRATRTPEGGTHPLTSVTSWNGRVKSPAGTGYADDHTCPADARLRRLAITLVLPCSRRCNRHHRSVGTALRHVDEVRHDIVANLLRIDEVGHAKFLAPFLAVRIDVDAG